jgi:hypothetical protein
LAVEFHTGRTSALAYLADRLRFLSRRKPEGEEQEQKQEPARQAAAVLPSPEVLNKIMRYETKLERPLCGGDAFYTFYT